MRVDLSICEHLGLANTAMLRVYAAVNPNFRLLCLFVKHWSQRRRVNDVSQHMLSSYAWSLLVLFVLQGMGRSMYESTNKARAAETHLETCGKSSGEAPYRPVHVHLHLLSTPLPPSSLWKVSLAPLSS